MSGGLIDTPNFIERAGEVVPRGSPFRLLFEHSFEALVGGHELFARSLGATGGVAGAEVTGFKSSTRE